jgi:7-cyano-7-deazaguanine synthase
MNESKRGFLAATGKEANPAVVLLSGGLDSAVTAALAVERGFRVHALSVQYGQRHAIELESARRVAKSLNVVQHVFTTIDLRTFGGSALTDDIPVPRFSGDSARALEIPVTYVPARNTVFLALALAHAETLASRDIFLGVNAVDYSGYPDCRPAFLEAFERLANVGTRAGAEGARFTIHAPLVSLSKSDIVREGARLGVDFSLTHSCYDPSSEGTACGTCDSCTLRRRGFEAAGIADPIPYPR